MWTYGANRCPVLYDVANGALMRITVRLEQSFEMRDTLVHVRWAVWSEV